MSYQVLARKYRPKSFRELVGQEHVARALINALDQDRLHHAYLFTGTRGVGKTTIARILAKCLNCETGISSEPCGVCSTCKEVDEGRFVDLIEVDAASRTKVEDTRELLDNVQYAPTRGRYKVYLIDEVHMLSGHSFNALLKTLEEPPPHVKFLLATTDPQKLPITILSRCLQFSLKAMSPERVVEHLTSVLQKELVTFEDAALWELGRAANGSMRDALSLTDQALAFGNGQLSQADVRTMLGSIDRDLVFRVISAINQGEAADVLAVCAQLAEQSVDFAFALTELISMLHRLALAQMLPQAIDNALGDQERVLALAGQMTAEDVQLYYQIAIHGRRDLPWAADLRSGFEMTLLRMLSFKPLPTDPNKQGRASNASPTARPPVAPQGAARPTGPQMTAKPSVAASVTPSMPARPTPVALPVNPPVNTQPAPNANVVSFPNKAVESSPLKMPAVLAKPSAIADLANPEVWADWVLQSSLVGAALNLLKHSNFVINANQVELCLSPKHELLLGSQSVEQVKAWLQADFADIAISITLQEPQFPTPVQVAQKREIERRQMAEAVLKQDPCVVRLMHDFQAEILTDTIIPRVEKK